MTIWAKITTQFEALHYWKDAKGDVAFLRYPHRHLFYVTIWIEEKHRDRDIELVQFKNFVNLYIPSIFGLYKNKVLRKSCEMIAQRIKSFVEKHYPKRKVKVEVLEDGENGAVIE